jgi:tetratricopeptide (TPR) repeat protein
MAEVALEQAPRKAREHYEKGLASLERGNLDYAMDMFLMALDLCPGLLRARKYMRAAALKKVKSGKTNSFTNIMTTLGGTGTLMKVQSLMKKKPDQALRAAEDLLRKDPLNPTFIQTACQAALAADMPEVALLNLEVARDNGLQDIKSLEVLANLYQENGRMHDAREAYETLVRLKPNDPAMVRKLKDATALDTVQRGRWEEASSYRDVMKDTKEATLLEQQSKAVKSNRDVDALVTETLAKIEREPQNVNYKRTLADLYQKSDRFDEALAVLDAAQKTTGGSDPQIDRMIGQVKISRFEKEAEELRAAGQETALAAKLKEKADFLFRDAADRVQRYPNDLQFKYEYGVLLFENGQINEAIQQFQRAQQNPQRRIRSFYYLALCFKQKQQLDIAAEQLEKAAAELTSMDETKKDVVYELGSIYEAMGKGDKASVLYKEIYAVDFGYRDIAAKIERAYQKPS